MPPLEQGYSYTQFSLGGSVLSVNDPRRILPSRLFVSLDGWQEEFEFIEGPGVNPESLIPPHTEVEIRFARGTLDEVVAFRGRCVSYSTMQAGKGWIHSHRARGLRYLADREPILNPGVGAVGYSFNLPSDHPEYSATLSGMTVGDMVARVATDHAAAFTARGIDVTQFLLDLESLDWTPFGPQRIAGERIWNSIDATITQHAPNWRMYLEHTTSGSNLRICDLGNPTQTISYVVGEDLVDPPSFSFDVSECYTRIRFCGAATIEPFELSISEGELDEDWTSPQELAWTIFAYEDTLEVRSSGAVVSMTSTTVTIDPDDEAREWDINYWAGQRKGRLMLKGTPIPGVESFETRSVASNDALTAGGTCAFVVSHDFTQNTFTSYVLYGQGTDADLGHVHRRFTPSDPDVKQALQNLFARDEPYAYQTMVMNTRAPLAFIVVGGIRYQFICEIDKGAGTIILSEPTVSHPACGNSRTDLETGGDDVIKPDDVVVFVPVAAKKMEAVYPPDSGGSPAYSGTGFDWFGIQETLTVFLREWKDGEATPQIEAYAEQLHGAFKDVNVTGSARIHGYEAHKFFPLGGKALSLTAVSAPGGAAVDLGQADGYAVPIRSISVEWGGVDGMTVSVAVDNRRGPGRGDSAYTHGISGDAITNQILAFQGLPAERGVVFGGWNGRVMDTLASTPDAGQFARFLTPSAASFGLAQRDAASFVGTAATDTAAYGQAIGALPDLPSANEAWAQGWGYARAGQDLLNRTYAPVRLQEAIRTGMTDFSAGGLPSLLARTAVPSVASSKLAATAGAGGLGGLAAGLGTIAVAAMQQVQLRDVVNGRTPRFFGKPRDEDERD